MISKRYIEKLIGNDKNSLYMLYKQNRKWNFFIKKYIKNKHSSITREELLLIIVKIDKLIIRDMENRNTNALTKIMELYENYFINQIRITAGKFNRFDCADLFYDCCLDLYENICNNKFMHKSSLGTYLITLGKNKLNNIIKKYITQKKYERNKDISIDPEHELLKKQIKEQLVTLNFKCKKIIELSFFDNASTNTIKWIMESHYNIKFPTESAVRMAKSNCLERLRKMII